MSRMPQRAHDPAPLRGPMHWFRHGDGLMSAIPLAERLARLSTVFSYYAIFSLIPLLLLATTITGFLFGWQAAGGLSATPTAQPAIGTATTTVLPMGSLAVQTGALSAARAVIPDDARAALTETR